MRKKSVKIGDVFFIFDDKNDKIFEMSVTQIVKNEKGKIESYNLISKDKNTACNCIKSCIDFLFRTYEDCMKFALNRYVQRVDFNSRSQPPTLHNMRRGEDDPLNNLIKEYLSKRNNLIGIEIGSYAGESTELFVKSGVFKTLYCIDPWEVNYDPSDPTSSPVLLLAEESFDKKFADSEVVKKIKAKSTDVLNQFEDNSIDFIYIDGCHTYEAVKEDLKNYYPKIKVGGIIAGHDYNGPRHVAGVKKAVDEFFKKTPLKVYGDNSWVYIKQAIISINAIK